MKKKQPTLYYSIVHSPDDGGYYAEIWDNGTSKTEHFTDPIRSNPAQASLDALQWIRGHGCQALYIPIPN